MKYLNFRPVRQVPASSNFTSDTIDFSQIYKFSAQISVPSGTVTGSVQLQVSNDEVTANYLSLQEPTNWSNLGSPVSLTTSGTSLITQQDSCYRSLRVVFTSSDGGASGLVTVNIMALAI